MSPANANASHASQRGAGRRRTSSLSYAPPPPHADPDHPLGQGGRRRTGGRGAKKPRWLLKTQMWVYEKALLAQIITMITLEPLLMRI